MQTILMRYFGPGDIVVEKLYCRQGNKRHFALSVGDGQHHQTFYESKNEELANKVIDKLRDNGWNLKEAI